MKILLAATNSELSSGASRSLLDLSKELKRQNIDVVVVVPKRGNLENELNKYGVKYYYVHEYSSWYKDNSGVFNPHIIKRYMNIWPLLKIMKIIKKEQIDIVHVNALTAYVAGWAASLSGCKLIWHMREFMEEDLNIAFFSNKYSYKKINKADRLIAISESIKDKWSQKLDPEIKIINNGVHVKNYYISQKKNVLTNITIMLYGRVSPGKGQLLYFQAIEKLINMGVTNINVKWAGQIEDENYYQEIIQFINATGVNDYTEYLGEVKDVKKLLNDVHIVCVCSQKEAFGRVTVESMLSKSIVIGADTGGTKEIIEDKKTGFLYKSGMAEDLADKLSYVVCNYEQLEELVENAQQTALKKYTIENNANQIIKLYKLCLNRDQETKKNVVWSKYDV